MGSEFGYYFDDCEDRQAEKAKPFPDNEHSPSELSKGSTYKEQGWNGNLDAALLIVPMLLDLSL